MYSTEQSRTGTLPKTVERDFQLSMWVELALWLAFLGNLGRAVLHNNDELRHIICRPMVDLAACILIFQGVRALIEGNRTSSSHKLHLLTCLVLVIAFVATTLGLASGPNLTLWFQMGPMAFGTGFAVFLARRPLVFEAVLRTLAGQIIFADIFVAYFLLHSTNESRFDWYWTPEGNEGLGAIANRCLFALPFLIANYRRLSPWQLLLVGAGFAEYAALNLKAENRSAVIIAFVVIPGLLIAITLRQGRSLRWVWKAVLCASILVAILFNVVSKRHKDFDTVMERFGVTDISTAKSSEILSGVNLTIWDNFAGNGPRSEEVRELLVSTSFAQFILGRGFGVGWYCPLYATLSHNWYIVHFGPGYMLLVGGLPLAICFTALLGLAMWNAWKNVKRVPSAAGALVFLSAAAVNYLQHGILLDEPEVYLLWLCIGFSMGAPKLYSLRKIGQSSGAAAEVAEGAACSSPAPA